MRDHDADHDAGGEEARERACEACDDTGLLTGGAWCEQWSECGYAYRTWEEGETSCACECEREREREARGAREPWLEERWDGVIPF